MAAGDHRAAFETKHYFYLYTVHVDCNVSGVRSLLLLKRNIDIFLFLRAVGAIISPHWCNNYTRQLQNVMVVCKSLTHFSVNHVSFFSLFQHKWKVCIVSIFLRRAKNQRASAWTPPHSKTSSHTRRGHVQRSPMPSLSVCGRGGDATVGSSCCIRNTFSGMSPRALL